MSGFHGQFCWCELLTTDTGAAEGFYKKVVGWGAMDSGQSGMNYTLFTSGETPVAGLMDLPPEVGGGRPAWFGYVAVDDLAEATTRFTGAGGAICIPPMEVPGIGSFAMVADPHGAALGLMQPAPGPTPPEVDPMSPGQIGWRELHAADGPAAFDFYSAQFGWTKDAAVPMGEMGVYQTFAAGGPAIGGMMTKTADMPAPAWLYYFNISDIDAGMARVTENGGRVLMGPYEVPGGGWIVQAFDPQGAMFALLGPRG